MADKEKVSPVAAIKRFFEAAGGKKLGMEEMKRLTGDDRKELGSMAADQLGLEIQA